MTIDLPNKVQAERVFWERGLSEVPLFEDALRKWLISNAKDGSILLLIPEGEFIAGGSGSDEGGASSLCVCLPITLLCTL